MYDPTYCDKIERPEIVLDLVTNGGVMNSGLKYEVDKVREDWFNKSSLTNISRFSDLVNKFRIKYDYKIEDEFWVHMNNKKVKFKRIENRIYEICPGTTNEKKKKLLQMQLINTVD